MIPVDLSHCRIQRRASEVSVYMVQRLKLKREKYPVSSSEGDNKNDETRLPSKADIGQGRPLHFLVPVDIAAPGVDTSESTCTTFRLCSQFRN